MLQNGIQAVHFEPTNKCNAGCPMCSRTNNNIILSDLQEIKYTSFKKFFPVEFVRGLKKFKFCGNYGDPAVAKDLLLMHEYLFKHNERLEVTLSTNGGIRSASFWYELGKMYDRPDSSHVQFHIDGLEDTNHIYRIGVKWDKVIRNAKSFLSANGNAVWYFIPFFHNEHQVEQAEILSKEIGFDEFIIKISARFDSFDKPFVYDGGKIYPPTADRFNIEDMQLESTLKCVSEERREIYVDAWGRLFPCCWTASRYNKSPSWKIYNNNVISLYNNDIRTILDSNDVNSWIQEQYSNTNSVCHKRCTGSHMHVLEHNGIKTPQKIMWLTKEAV